MTDNGISNEMVDRELTYALATSEMLYKTNLRRSSIFRITVLIIRFFKLDHIVKKMLKWESR